MVWDSIKRWLGLGNNHNNSPPQAVRAGGISAPRPDLAKLPPQWVDASDSPFGIRVLDVRPVTLGTISASADPTMASNAVSYGGEDGSSFANDKPVFERIVDRRLHFRSPDFFADGALFIPSEMEDKWALFVHKSELICVRSWQRKVYLRAPIKREKGELIVGPMFGAIMSPEEPEDFTYQALDFLLRTHALRMSWPSPLPSDGPPQPLALLTMQMFGRQSHYATLDPLPNPLPDKPLRTLTRLHFAVLQDDIDKVTQALTDGVPPGLLDFTGNSPLHYVTQTGKILDLLIQYGADLNQPAEHGATLLMLAVQKRNHHLFDFLLEHNAMPDQADDRGFTALHRAAEMNEIKMVEALLAKGADPERTTPSGHSPKSLAKQIGNHQILKLFNSR